MSLDDAPPAEYAPALSGADYGEVYLEDSSWLSARIEDARIQDVASGAERGLGIRLLRQRDGRIESYFSSSSDVSPAEASRLRDGLLPRVDSGISFAPAVRRESAPRVEPGAVALDLKVDLLHRLDAIVRAEYPTVRQVTASYGEKIKRTRVINSEGADARQRLVATVITITVVAEENGRLQTGSEVVGAQHGFELTLEEPLAAARRAAARAFAKLRAPKAKAGEMRVVLSSSAGGTFIHEAIGHSLEADLVQEGSSPSYSGALGRVIAPESITVIDDPTLPGQRGSFFFDDEGVVATATPLVERGVLRSYLHDRTTALRDGVRSNGHGRRESYADAPYPRMSNLYVAPGAEDPAAIIASLDRGLLVTRMGGGQVNTATGEFVFEVDEGWWVEDGVVRHMIRDANLLGIGPDVLRAIDKVGWDTGWGIGTCGKEGQSVPVSDGQPTLRLPKILVGGTHEE